LVGPTSCAPFFPQRINTAEMEFFGNVAGLIEQFSNTKTGKKFYILTLGDRIYNNRNNGTFSILDEFKVMPFTHLASLFERIF
jgi:hypothetical protein